MCIRDSNGIGQASRSFNAYSYSTTIAADLDDDVNTLELAAGYSAVSYTHLRAHETVLDLVCRLLLEKKKTKNSNSIRQLVHTYHTKNTYDTLD